MGDLAGQQDAGADVGPSVSGLGPHQPDDPLQQVQQTRHDEPVPEVGRVQDQQDVEGNVQQVGPVENLKRRERAVAA